jgi:hypothetical protein
MVRHLRRRCGFPAVFWLFSAHLLAGPECRTHAEGVTGNVVFAGDARLMSLYPTVDAVVPLHSDGQIGVDGAELNPVYFAGDQKKAVNRGLLRSLFLFSSRRELFGQPVL